jgi:hypothetical protein
MDVGRMMRARILADIRTNTLFSGLSSADPVGSDANEVTR